MKKIFIDSDVLLDVVFERKPSFRDSQGILAAIEKSRFRGFTSALILANIYYIISANKNKSIAESTVAKLRSILTILPFTDKEIGESLHSGFKDFENGVQYYIAVNNGIGTFITRNISDYKNADIHIFLPKDFLALNAINKAK